MIRSIKQTEIGQVAKLLATAYHDDIFFKWCVPDEADRQRIVTAYYEIYLRSRGCVSHVATSENGEIIGATVWLPHDCDASMYDDIERVVGIYAPQFNAVAEKSHANEPTEFPFYQLVGFGVAQSAQGQGVGQQLLAYFLNQLDKEGIATYLEASTPFTGGGVYGKFGYQMYSDLMTFTETAVLYPLYRLPKKKTAFICDESYFWHNAGESTLFEPAGGYLQASGSAESPESKRRFKNLLERSGLMDELIQIKPNMATEEQLEYFHTKCHIENVQFLSDGHGGDCGDSAIVGRGSYEIAKLAVGGAIEAVKAVVENPEIANAYALTRPPGHHAEADQGIGYCIFNNVVIAAKYAQKHLGIRKILILDWDAHHGNGTEDAFYDDDSVFFISLHQDNLEPIGRGQKGHIGTDNGRGFTLNIPLPAASGDAAYQYAFEQIVIPAVEKFQPELILVSAGQDASIFDPLARMMVSAEGYRQMTELTKKLAQTYANGRLVCLHEGGYSAEYVPFCSHAIVEELSEVRTDVKDPFIYAMAGTGYDKLLPHQQAQIDDIRDYFRKEGCL